MYLDLISVKLSILFKVPARAITRSRRFPASIRNLGLSYRKTFLVNFRRRFTFNPSRLWRDFTAAHFLDSFFLWTVFRLVAVGIAKNEKCRGGLEIFRYLSFSVDLMTWLPESDLFAVEGLRKLGILGLTLRDSWRCTGSVKKCRKRTEIPVLENLFIPLNIKTISNLIASAW